MKRKPGGRVAAKAFSSVWSLLNVPFEKSVGTTELHYSTKKRYHVLTILKSFFSSDTRQSMKRRIATER